MTNKKIEKALECCFGGTCRKCPYYPTHTANCIVQLEKDALDYINRLKVEIEKLKAIDNIVAFNGNVKQAVKEFAEKVKPIIGELVELMFNDYESHCKVTNCEKDDDIPCGCNICIEENEQLWKSKIDNLITELYGGEE